MRAVRHPMAAAPFRLARRGMLRGRRSIA